MDTLSNTRQVSRRTCPHCHAAIDWQASDAAYSDAAEYRICPACDEAVFVAWRTADGPDSAAAAAVLVDLR